MNGLLYGRFIGILFLVMGLIMLGLQLYGIQDNGSYFPVMLILGFVLVFVGPAFFVWPGPSDIRFDTADDYDDRRDKGQAWSETIKQPRLLWRYAGATTLGFIAASYTEAYVAGDALTNWVIPLKIALLTLVTGLVGWRLIKRNQHKS